MPNYDNIKNEKLRQLVTLSESIHSQPEEVAQAMIDQIAALPEEGQTAMITAMEDEQKAIQEAKAAKGITPEQEIRDIEENMAKVSTIKRDFESSVRKINEEKEREESDKEAEDLLKKLE